MSTRNGTQPKAKPAPGFVYDDQRHSGRTTELVCGRCGTLISPTRATPTEADITAHALLRHGVITVDVLWADTAQHLDPDAWKSHRFVLGTGDARTPGEWITERCHEPWCLRPADDHPTGDEILAAAYKVTVLQETSELEEKQTPAPDPAECGDGTAAEVIERARAVHQQRRRRAHELADARLTAARGHWPMPLVRTEPQGDPLGARRRIVRFHLDGSRAA